MKNAPKPLKFAGPAAWRAWLEKHHAHEREAWLLHYKKGAAKSALGYEAAVEEALCFGWIDGRLQRLDADSFILRYSPRRPNSIWSVINRRRVERLIHQGRMTPAGLAAVAQAKANGEWEAAVQREDVSRAPPDLERALRQHAQARAAFKAWPASRKKMTLQWIASAKKPETRAKRIGAVIDMILEKKSP